jgi:hypothetical protein
MKRIVNGHFADPNSTRDIIDITMGDYELLGWELNQYSTHMKRYLEMEDDEMLPKMKKMMMLGYSQMPESPEKEQMLKLVKAQYNLPNFADSLRAELKITCEFAKEITDKSIVNSSLNWSIIGLTTHQFAILISAMQAMYTAYTSLIENDDNEEFKDKIMEDFADESDIKGALRDHPLLKHLTDEDQYAIAKIELCKMMLTKVVEWLTALNQPYEGAEY